MSVGYVLEMTITDGKVDDFKKQADGYIASVKDSEAGTLEYQWYLSEDGGKCIIVETFTDSDAMLTHLGNVGPTLPNLLAIAPITRLEVLGSASDAAKEALAAFGAVHYPHYNGFDKR